MNPTDHPNVPNRAIFKKLIRLCNIVATCKELSYFMIQADEFVNRIPNKIGTLKKCNGRRTKTISASNHAFD
jgi:hypothetical protein